jgi:hypothetical protein
LIYIFLENNYKSYDSLPIIPWDQYNAEARYKVHLDHHSQRQYFSHVWVETLCDQAEVKQILYPRILKFVRSKRLSMKSKAASTEVKDTLN